MSSVLFAYRTAPTAEGNYINGREQLFEKLRDLSLEPVISVSAEHAFQEAGILVSQQTPGEGIESPTVRQIGAIGLIVNRMNRSFTLAKLPADVLVNMPPILNENAMRSLTHRKHRVWSEVFKPLAMGIPTQLVSEPDEVSAFTADHDAIEYIVKPYNGTSGKGVMRLPKVIAEKPGAVPVDGSQIIQPAYDFSHSLPAGLRAYDVASREAFDGWSKSGATKELRVYGFHSPLATVVFPVGRAIQDGVDHWFFVDPESVPTQLLELSKMAISTAAAVSKSQAVLATVDSGYGSISGHEPDFHAIELNGKAPYIIGYDKHAGVADKLRQMLSIQIRQTIDFIGSDNMPERVV